MGQVVTQPPAWTADRYEDAASAGAFGAEARVELIGGEVHQVAAMLPGHASTLRRIRGRLAEALDPSRYVLGSQEPVRLDQESEPEPDLWVAQAPAARYHDRHPSPADLALVVEVADTSLAFDQRVKLPRYARAGIPEVWLVSLPERVVHRYLGPSGDRYASHDALAGGRLSAVGVDLDVSELLPGA